MSAVSGQHAMRFPIRAQHYVARIISGSEDGGVYAMKLSFPVSLQDLRVAIEEPVEDVIGWEKDLEESHDPPPAQQA